MNTSKVLIGVIAGAMILLCFIRDLKVEDVAKELVKKEVQEKISHAKEKIDSVKVEAKEEVKKKFNLLKPFFPNK